MELPNQFRKKRPRRKRNENQTVHCPGCGRSMKESMQSPITDDMTQAEKSNARKCAACRPPAKNPEPENYGPTYKAGSQNE